MKRTKESVKEFRLRRQAAGLISLSTGIQTTASNFGLSARSVEYWQQKLLDPEFHSNSHGGVRYVSSVDNYVIKHRNAKFTLFEHQKIRALLWLLVKNNPTQKIAEYVQEIRMRGYDCKREFIRCIFRSWKWSWKRPSFQQLNKYTNSNLARWRAYADWVASGILFFIIILSHYS